jgi:hypothetical protein
MIKHAPTPQRPIETLAELGEMKTPYLGSPSSNLTWEGQLAQGTHALRDTKAATSDRRPWVRWTARFLFLFAIVGPLAFAFLAVLFNALFR